MPKSAKTLATSKKGFPKHEEYLYKIEKKIEESMEKGISTLGYYHTMDFLVLGRSPDYSGCKIAQYSNSCMDSNSKFSFSLYLCYLISKYREFTHNRYYHNISWFLSFVYLFSDRFSAISFSFFYWCHYGCINQPGFKNLEDQRAEQIGGSISGFGDSIGIVTRYPHDAFFSFSLSRRLLRVGRCASVVPERVFRSG